MKTAQHNPSAGPGTELTNSSKAENNAPGRRRGGFTLIELLVVIAIIAILASMLLPVLAKAKQHALITTCLNDEHQQVVALSMYANDYKDQLPNNSAAGAWAWDCPVLVRNVLTNCGTTRKTWYDPGIMPPFTEQDCIALWNYTAGYGVMGYTMTFDGTAGYTSGAQPTFATNTNRKMTMNSTFYQISTTTITVPVHPATRALTACPTLMADPGSTVPAGGAVNSGSQNAANLLTMQKYNWTDVPGGFAKHHTSPHLLSSRAKYPSGANVGTLDCHVTWVPFRQMLPRAGGGGPPYFWF